MSEYSKRIDKLMDVYLSHLMSTDQDAGWHQPSQLQRMIEFKGDIPPPTGNDQADLKMLSEIRWLREPHALLPLAKALIGRLKPKHRIPLIVHHRYAGTINKETGRYWTEGAIADELKIRLHQYRERKRFARITLARWLRELEEQQGKGAREEEAA